MIFRDRTDAGNRLASALLQYDDDEPVVLGLPRGGVPVAARIAAALHAPLDVVLVRKIGAPSQPELAAGAVVDADRPVIVRNEDVIATTAMTEAQFDRALADQLAEIARRRTLYGGDRNTCPLADRTVIVVDDGIATGATMRAALQGLRLRSPRRLIVATPVAPPEAIAALHDLADEIVCLQTRSDFAAIGQFYDDFSQLEDDEVIAILHRASLQRSARSGPKGQQDGPRSPRGAV